MQPENSHPSTPGFEQLPMPPTGGLEAVPNLPPLDIGVERGNGQVEQMAEARARVTDAAAISTAPLVAPSIPASDAQRQVVASSATPLVAADEDVMEKEWVDKAKEIMLDTVQNIKKFDFSALANVMATK